jgi:ABC-type glycerol-3-phosphate transport system substrate-binding protein
LNSYVSSFRYAPRNAAMMIMFIAHTSRLFDLDYSSVAGKFDVGEVPGGHPVMSGWSLGITKACPNPNAAYRFMRWTCSSKIAIPYTVLGGCTPRSSLNQIEELSSSFSTIACGER